MKKLLLLLLTNAFLQLISAQITTPIVKANFGVEADLTANFFNATNQPGQDDWFSNGYPGTGQFIIDTSGAASIMERYVTQPSTRSWTFSRLMHQAPYAVVNNMLLLDAIFHRDFHGDDSTVFASGSNKNGMSPSLWSCPDAQGIPDKNDILDTYTHVRRDGPNATDSLWMFAGLSLENTTGSRYFDFELYQTDIIYNRAAQKFSGYGPDAGHTSWVFDAAGNIITPGDIIFTAEFNSSSITLVEARIWVKNTSLSINPVTFNWGGDFDGDGSGATFGYANILPKTAGAFYTGIQNTAKTWAGPFGLVRVDNTVTSSYIPKQFMEFSVNLTKLGIEPASFSNNPCGTPFRRVLIKSRASNSFTAELKDFVAPFKMFDYPQLDAFASLNYFCGTVMSTSINVSNPVPTSIYTWSTSTGNIVGSTSGNSITVDAPGTYYVRQQLHSQCPNAAIDSVTIVLQANCTVLNVNTTQLDAQRKGRNAALKWKSNNNDLVASYEVEYSYNNSVFRTLTAIPSSGKPLQSQYDYTYLLEINEPPVFYRIKIIGKDKQISYSNTVLLRSAIEGKMPFIFPNPSNGKAWLSLESFETTEASIVISDMAGHQIKTFKVTVKAGENILPIFDLSAAVNGIYIVKIITRQGNTTQKITLIR